MAGEAGAAPVVPAKIQNTMIYAGVTKAPRDETATVTPGNSAAGSFLFAFLPRTT